MCFSSAVSFWQSLQRIWNSQEGFDIVWTYLKYIEFNKKSTLGIVSCINIRG